jgi:glycolate oxidase
MMIWTGANVLKNATGYNLTQLVVGSEGTLGVITKIVLRLIPVVKHDMLLLVPFRSAVEACEAVNAIFLAGYTPSALEFMERDALEWSMRYVQSAVVNLPAGYSGALTYRSRWQQYRRAIPGGGGHIADSAAV